MKCHNGAEIILASVLYIPKLQSNILSVGQLDDQSSKALMQSGRLSIYDNKERLLTNVKKDTWLTILAETKHDRVIFGG